jgi:hypothetical protein
VLILLAVEAVLDLSAEMHLIMTVDTLVMEDLALPHTLLGD